MILGERIKATFKERVATQDASKAEKTAFEGPVFTDGLTTIMTARGGKAAGMGR